MESVNESSAAKYGFQLGRTRSDNNVYCVDAELANISECIGISPSFPRGGNER
ncbi:hypothetical protein D3C76_1760880 [compost metagenome]